MQPVSSSRSLKSYLTQEKELTWHNAKVKNSSLIPYKLPMMIKKQSWRDYFMDTAFYRSSYSLRDFLNFNFEQKVKFDNIVELNEIRDCIYDIIRSSSLCISTDALSQLNTMIIKNRDIVNFFVLFTDSLKSFLLEDNSLFNTAYESYINRNENNVIEDLEINEDMLTYIDMESLLNINIELKNKNLHYPKIMHVKVMLTLLMQLNLKEESIHFESLASTLALLDLLNVYLTSTINLPVQLFVKNEIEKVIDSPQKERQYINDIVGDEVFTEPLYLTQGILLCACSSILGLRGGMCNALSYMLLMSLDKGSDGTDFNQLSERRLPQILQFKNQLQQLKTENALKINQFCSKMLEVSFFLQYVKTGSFFANSDENELKVSVANLDDFTKELQLSENMKTLLIHPQELNTEHAVCLIPIAIKNTTKSYFYFDANLGLFFASDITKLTSLIKITVNDLAQYTGRAWNDRVDYSYIDINPHNTEVLNTLVTKDGWSYFNLLEGITSGKFYESKCEGKVNIDEGWKDLFG